MESKIGQLKWKDLAKGAILAFIVAFLTGVLTLLQAGTIEWTFAFWQPTIIAGVIALIGYLLKNLATNSDDEFLTPEK